MMIGKTISHYRILEKLGDGGMGVVYKAHDTTLDHTVALKLLPSDVASNESDKVRFQQEARAAAALNHPNICTIHSFEESDHQRFIVMEYVDGETLRQKIQKSRGTNLTGARINDICSYGIQIGEALHEAYAKGIVHRDIKPENIMVNSKNQIKVMDFGLAKLKGSLRLTRTSNMVGTCGYISPEQLRSDEVDCDQE